MKLLRIALDSQRWDLAAHCLVIGLVKARQKQGAAVKGPSKSKLFAGGVKVDGKRKQQP